MQIGLAEHDGTGAAQCLHHRRILRRLEVPQCRRARGGRIVARIDAVLHRDRQAEQGSDPRGGASLEVALACRLKHPLGVERDEGVQCALILTAPKQR